MSSDGVQIHARQVHVDLNPHHDARAIVRLLQCPQCSYPFRQPMTLPCGNSLCKECIPPLFKRENITYPQLPGRSEGFVCPFKDCGLPHTLGDCSLDITFNKIIESARSSLSANSLTSSDISTRLDEKLHWPDIIGSAMDVMPRSRVLPGSRLAATFRFAEMGELNFQSEVAYTNIGDKTTKDVEAEDTTLSDMIKEIVRGEVECQVCYALMLDPLTTPCGHTFCRKCVARMLDHSNLCPICRRWVAMVPGVHSEPSNKAVSKLISCLLPDQLGARMAMAETDEITDAEAGVPLFPCALAYPSMPTFLHIFEPRYRLMIRRALTDGSRRFGILAYNASRQPQGQFGQVPFMQYGTMLHIQRVEVLPDGRSLIETKGIYRFRVLEYSMLDGYMVGKLQRIDDVSFAEEEAIEARETAVEPQSDDANEQLNAMSTQALLQIGIDFVVSARARSASWLTARVLAAYGQPPIDPATFPYWFASVLPISEEEKYRLIPTTSVRERLKITARWIQRLEAARCSHAATLMRTVLDDSSDEESDTFVEEETDDIRGGSDEVPHESVEVRSSEPEAPNISPTGPTEEAAELQQEHGSPVNFDPNATYTTGPSVDGGTTTPSPLH